MFPIYDNKDFFQYYELYKKELHYSELDKFRSGIMSITGLSLGAFMNRISGRTDFTVAEKVAIHIYFKESIDREISYTQLFPVKKHA